MLTVSSGPGIAITSTILLEKLVRFSLGLLKDGELVGAIIVAFPIARATDLHQVAEVTRLAADGTPNASSQLLAAAARVAKEMGFARFQMFVEQTEISAPSFLKAAKMTFDGETSASDWSHERKDDQDRRPRRESTRLPKHRWVMDFHPVATVTPGRRRHLILTLVIAISGASCSSSPLPPPPIADRLCAAIPAATDIPPSWRSRQEAVSETVDLSSVFGITAPVSMCSRRWYVGPKTSSHIPCEAQITNMELASEGGATSVITFFGTHNETLDGPAPSGPLIQALSVPSDADEGFGSVVAPTAGELNISIGVLALIAWRQGQVLNWVEVSCFDDRTVPLSVSLMDLEQIAQHMADTQPA